MGIGFTQIGDFIACNAFHGVRHGTIRIAEEYVSDLRKPGIHGDIPVHFSHNAEGIKFIIANIPADKLVTLLGGGSGLILGVPDLHDLGRHLRAVCGESVGGICGFTLRLYVQSTCISHGLRRHIVDTERQLLRGFLGEGQGSGAVLVGEDVLCIGIHGNSAGHSREDNFGAGLSGDSNGVDEVVGVSRLFALRSFLFNLQVTADGVGHISSLLGLGLLGLHRGVVHVDGAGGIGVGAGENRLVLAVGPRGHGGGEGVALHSGDIRHEGLFRLLRTEHQLLGGEGMALLAVGVDSTKHHSQLHAGLRFCGFCGLRGGRGLRRIGSSLRALRGIGPGGFPGRTRGIPGLGRGFYSQGLRGGAALRGLGGAGFGGFLPTAPRAAAGQQPSGGVQDAGGQDDGYRHNQGQDTGM